MGKIVYVAQRLALRPDTSAAGGSNPSIDTFGDVAQLVEHRPEESGLRWFESIRLHILTS